MEPPTRFILDVNHDCNLECQMCVKRTMKNPHGQRPLEDFVTLVNKLPWAEEISIGALGDPFLYKDIRPSLNYLSSKRIRSPITTNATLITSSNLKFIPMNTQMHISIEGDGHIDSYKKIEGSFSELKKKVHMIKDLRPDIKIAINHLLFKTNIKTAKDIIDFCSEIGASIIFFFPMYFTKELEKRLNVFYLDNLTNKLSNLAELCLEKDVPYYMTFPPKRQRPCLRSLTQPIVAFDGTVYPCDYVYQNIENTEDGTWKSWHLGKAIEVPQHQYRMGNLYEESFLKMWNSKKWETLRKKVTRAPLQKSFDEVLEEADLSLPFEHCKVCLARWSVCL